MIYDLELSDVITINIISKIVRRKVKQIASKALTVVLITVFCEKVCVEFIFKHSQG